MQSDYERFEGHLTRAEKDFGTETSGPFRKAVGELFDREIHKATENKYSTLGEARRIFMTTAHALCGMKPPEKITDYIRNFRDGTGGFPRATPPYFLIYLTKELHIEANALFGILCADKQETFKSLSGWALEPRYLLDDIISGKLLAKLDKDPFAPVLTPPSSQSETHFSNTKVEVLGREKQKELLCEFMTGGGFQWLQLAGVGGQGKSRLAYELIKNFKGLWNANFLVDDNLRAFATDSRCERWVPQKATLIVIDYVIGQEAHVGPILQALAKRSDQFTKSGIPVRLLLVERQRWDRGGFKKHNIFSTVDWTSSDTLIGWDISLSKVPHWQKRIYGFSKWPFVAKKDQPELLTNWGQSCSRSQLRSEKWNCSNSFFLRYQQRSRRHPVAGVFL